MDMHAHVQTMCFCKLRNNEKKRNVQSVTYAFKPMPSIRRLLFGEQYMLIIIIDVHFVPHISVQDDIMELRCRTEKDHRSAGVT